MVLICNQTDKVNRQRMFVSPSLLMIRIQNRARKQQSTLMKVLQRFADGKAK